MTNSLVLSITTFIYCGATFFYIIGCIFKKNIFNKIGSFVSIVAIILNIIGFSLRWIESYKYGIGHIPLSNLYESLVFFSLNIAIVYIYLEFRYKNYLISATASLVAFLSIAYASLSPSISNKITPLIPALKSNWLTVHVITCFFGYAGFTLSFVISILYLFSLQKNSLDEINYQMVVFGFLFLTIGIITGSVWANSAWGTYWSWDPKETWSLITWLVYAVLIHARLMRNWQGKRIAYISIIGFIAILITYFGVNYLPGLHSYGK